MNWFADLYPGLVPAADAVAAAWRIAAVCLLGLAIGAIGLGLERARPRLAVVLAVALGWEFLLPDRPLAALPGRFAGFQDEVLLIVLLGVFGCAGALRALARPRLPVVTAAVACLVVAGLAYGYHLLLLNGLDTAYRALDEVELVHVLGLDPESRSAICALPGLACGTGLPDTANAAFDADLADHVGFAMPPGTPGRLASSSGTAGSPSFVWAARRDAADALVWVMRDYGARTRALAFAYFAIQLAVAIFWLAGALLVEFLHIRAQRRRALRS